MLHMEGRKDCKYRKGKKDGTGKAGVCNLEANLGLLPRGNSIPEVESSEGTPCSVFIGISLLCEAHNTQEDANVFFNLATSLSRLDEAGEGGGGQAEVEGAGALQSPRTLSFPAETHKWTPHKLSSQVT